MKVVINHQYTQEKAIQCAEELIRNLTDKYKDEISEFSKEKTDNIILFSLTARGMKIKGKITVEEKTVTIESKLPLALKIFEGMLEKKILENADKEILKCK